MLLSLLLKDLLVARYRGLLVLGIALVLLLSDSAAPAATLPARGLSLVYFVTSIFVLQVATGEEKGRGDILLQILPVSRRQVVLSRYFLVAVLSLGLALAYATVLAARTRMQPPVDAALLLRCVAAAVPLPILYWALLLPVSLKYGMTRSVGLLTFLPVLLTLAPARITRLTALGALNVVRAVVALAPVTQLGLALGLAGIVACVSYLVAVRLYERRDF